MKCGEETPLPDKYEQDLQVYEEWKVNYISWVRKVLMEKSSSGQGSTKTKPTRTNLIHALCLLHNDYATKQCTIALNDDGKFNDYFDSILVQAFPSWSHIVGSKGKKITAAFKKLYDYIYRIKSKISKDDIQH